MPDAPLKKWEKKLGLISFERQLRLAGVNVTQQVLFCGQAIPAWLYGRIFQQHFPQKLARGRFRIKRAKSAFLSTLTIINIPLSIALLTEDKLFIRKATVK